MSCKDLTQGTSDGIGDGSGVVTLSGQVRAH